MRKTIACVIAGAGLLGLAGGESPVHAGLVSIPAAWLQAEEQAPAQGQQQPPEDAAPATNASGTFSEEQLEQLVAPIALYPDSLLLQILMASTYPLEVVEADRFVKKNPELKDEALDEALKEHDWDPSVKSLTKLPDVLKMMSENLDWTQDLGDALLAQKNEVMDTVQKMRGLAYEAGNLESTEQQTVTQQEDNIIVIEPADPEVIYVPSYSSTVVYGSSWGYPYWYYPPMYYPPPPGYGLISFGIGLAIGGAIWGNCNWGWGHTDIDIDINRFNEFNRNTSIDSDRTRIDQRGGRDGKANWQHDPSHRKGVNYRSEEVARNHGARTGSNRVTRDQARGAVPGNTARTGNRAASRDISVPSTRPSTGSRDYGSGRAGASDRSAFSGSRSPSVDRMSSHRGASSRGTRSYGGARMGGGRMGGGRRR